MCLWVSVLLGQTKINNIDLISSLANAHQEVVWLDITVDEALCVDVLDSADELVCQKKDGLQGEFSVAEVEEIFKRWTKQIEDHGVVVTFCTKPTHERDADASSK